MRALGRVAPLSVWKSAITNSWRSGATGACAIAVRHSSSRTSAFMLDYFKLRLVTWRSAAEFESMTTLDSGGAEIVWIPAGSLLENVLLPPNPAFDDPDSG